MTVHNNSCLSQTFNLLCLHLIEALMVMFYQYSLLIPMHAFNYRGISHIYLGIICFSLWHCRCRLLIMSILHSGLLWDILIQVLKLCVRLLGSQCSLPTRWVLFSLLFSFFCCLRDTTRYLKSFRIDLKLLPPLSISLFLWRFSIDARILRVLMPKKWISSTDQSMSPNVGISTSTANTLWNIVRGGFQLPHFSVKLKGYIRDSK